MSVGVKRGACRVPIEQSQLPMSPPPQSPPESPLHDPPESPLHELPESPSQDERLESPLQAELESGDELQPAAVSASAVPTPSPQSLAALSGGGAWDGGPPPLPLAGMAVGGGDQPPLVDVALWLPETGTVPGVPTGARGLGC
jgi:hypothetical protein